MPSLTPNYGFKKPLVNNPTDQDLWGGYTNENWDLLDTLLQLVGGSTGDVKFTIKTVADTGWVMCNDGTIGAAGSGGTTRANADTQALFTLLWNNVSNTYAAVSGGRGANAAADFAAGKTIALTKMLGRALAVAGSGASLTSRELGQTLGEETHILSTAEMPSHTHSLTDPGHRHIAGDTPVNTNVRYGVATSLSGGNVNQQSGTGTSGAYTSTATTGITIGNAGSGTAHNNMQPTSFLNAMIKL